MKYMQSAVKVWRRQKKDKELLGKTGVVLSWTRINVAPPQFQKQTPYTVALIQIDGADRVYGQIVDCAEHDIMIGMKVQSILRVNGNVGSEDLIEYGIKFKPI